MQTSIKGMIVERAEIGTNMTATVELDNGKRLEFPVTREQWNNGYEAGAEVKFTVSVKAKAKPTDEELIAQAAPSEAVAAMMGSNQTEGEARTLALGGGKSMSAADSAKIDSTQASNAVKAIK